MAERSSDPYARATQLNALLATSSDKALITEARDLANGMLTHVRESVADYEEFVRRVHLSERFSLTESLQIARTEKDLKVVYMRACGLLETAAEAAARATHRERSRAR